MKSLMLVMALGWIMIGIASAAPLMADFWTEKFKDSMGRAEQGDAEAQYTVANMYERGKGTEYDPRLAVVWYRKAAEQDLDKAEYKLGYCYYEGLGVDRDLQQAIVWFNKAAARGYPPAQYYLGVSYSESAQSTEDYDRALKWLSAAYGNGFTAADSKLTEVRRLRDASKTPEAEATPAKIAAAGSAAMPAAPAAAPPPTPEEILLGGRWRDAKKQPALHFPSALTHCARSADAIVCTTAHMNRSLPSADITYLIETTIDTDPTTGKLYLVMRNNVLVVTPEDDAPAAAVPKTGWQFAKKYLDCELAAATRIVCGNGGLDMAEYTRDGS